VYAPLTPLLANIVLDELDSARRARPGPKRPGVNEASGNELERRGLRFVRYADDVAVYVRTPEAAERVMRSLGRFITGRLKLSVNEEKSSAGRPWHSKYLGFRITRLIGKTRACIHPDSVKRFRKKVRELTRATGAGASGRSSSS